jgi:predicted alpha-1,2-mannosidase
VDMNRPSQTSLARLVNLHMGGIGHLLTATEPAVLLPHGMMRVVPWTSPEHYPDRFLHEHLEGIAFDAFRIRVGRDQQVGSERDHDWEQAYPFLYVCEMPSIDAELACTVSWHALMLRLRARSAGQFWLEWSSAEPLIVENGQTALGFTLATSASGVTRWVRIESTTAATSAYSRGRFRVRYALQPGETVHWRIALSYIDAEQARENLTREIPNRRTFEEVADDAESQWNQALGRILVEGGSAEERATFYTCLYRALSRMTNITEYGRYYSGYDHRTHRDAQDFYVNDGMWDTYRTMHPLQLLIEPRRHRDMIMSYVRMAEQSGLLPSFPRVEGERPTMIGKHAVAVVADTMSKDPEAMDWARAYPLLRRSMFEETRLPWRSGAFTPFDRHYQEHGYYPALAPGEPETLPEVHPFERRQAVSVTLECAYDDWCLGEMARRLGYTDDARLFNDRAQNYRQCFNPGTGFMHPKDAFGQWIADFNPELSGGQGGRDYFTEANSYIYSFHVQHDIAGLMECMGGAAAMAERLDRLFTMPPSVSKYRFFAQFPDSTGLMGLYPIGNEPSFHIPYLYNYAGQPWKTQRRVRDIIRLWFNTSPLGFPGDEDGGAMSAWYVWTAMGLYPTCPGRPLYDLGSPLFDQVTIRSEQGPTFTVVARDVSRRHKYIKRAAVNGQKLMHPQVRHDEWVREGGTLILDMSDHPHDIFSS